MSFFVFFFGILLILCLVFSNSGMSKETAKKILDSVLKSLISVNEDTQEKFEKYEKARLEAHKNNDTLLEEEAFQELKEYINRKQVKEIKKKYEEEVKTTLGKDFL